MARWLCVLVPALLAAMAPDSADACRIAGPIQPFGPVIPEDYDALLIGVFAGDAPASHGQVRAVEQIYGDTRDTSFEVADPGDDRIEPDGTIILGCARRYVFQPGERILLALVRRKRVQSVVSWTPLDFAAAHEPFIARYLRTRGQAARRRLVIRWRAAQTAVGR
jgi:hypothetical protein